MTPLESARAKLAALPFPRGWCVSPDLTPEEWAAVEEAGELEVPL